MHLNIENLNIANYFKKKNVENTELRVCIKRCMANLIRVILLTMT